LFQAGGQWFESTYVTAYSSVGLERQLIFNVS